MGPINREGREFLLDYIDRRGVAISGYQSGLFTFCRGFQFAFSILTLLLLERPSHRTPQGRQSHRRQSWGVKGGRDPPNFGQGGRKILLYLIMYRKYVRKW